ncbi:FG-GAP repeat protein [Natrinema longum]|uniref:FG-GAP repeat protein n=1 Tax=Natrinema longum TaxID=370324 RepID=A0A8A2U6Z5_9EURY|nr:FG-GAP repeat protein [Natrinema longum]MBZ6494067.1 FG-GAP repeat protein [Natrinema longum]QSW84599.1 FG-GAP repeat protein [Natrinema longum]
MKNTQRIETPIDDRNPTVTRRGLLAAGGLLAVSGLSGCLDRAAGAATNTGASPAAYWDGDATRATSGTEAIRAYGAGQTDVRYVPATIRGGAGFLSGEVDLEGWSTSAATSAQDYNSSRSNKPRSEWWGQSDDSDDANDDSHATVLEVERELLGHVDSALDAVSRRSKADSREALDAFIDATTTSLRPELDRCTSDVCSAVRESSDGRVKGVRAAMDAVDAEDWDEADGLLEEVRGVVEGDITRLEDARANDTRSNGSAVGTPDWIDDTDDDGDGIPDVVAALYDYLADDPTIGERFTVCLPDARLPADRGALADELTPRRVIEYFTGEPNGERCEANGREGAARIHRDIACRDLLSATLDEQSSKGSRGVAAFTTRGGVCVTGVLPDADGAETMLYVTEDRTTPKLYQGVAYAPDSLDEWGEETVADGVAVTPTLVCPVLATPADCPCPMPALFYVRRCKHDEQYLFTGGWLIDDGALYENTMTLLASEGPTEVVAVSAADVDGDGYGDLVTGRLSRPRSRYGTTMLSGGHDRDADYLPAALRTEDGADGLNALREGNDRVVRKKPGRTRGEQAGDDATDDGDAAEMLVMALDAPVVHLAAAEASNDVKFKAGAELSKSVN